MHEGHWTPFDLLNRKVPMVMDRRQFIRRTGIAALAGWLTPACAAPAESGELDPPGLLSALGAERVRELGRGYREMEPAESDARSLRRAILEAAERAGSGSSVEDAPLESLVRTDFQQGRTVVVDGWILSVTEARQCALFSLRPA